MSVCHLCSTFFYVATVAMESRDVSYRYNLQKVARNWMDDRWMSTHQGIDCNQTEENLITKLSKGQTKNRRYLITAKAEGHLCLQQQCCLVGHNCCLRRQGLCIVRSHK